MTSLRLSGLLAAAVAVAAGGWALSSRAQASLSQEGRAGLTQGFRKGACDHQAIGPLAFSPEGVLFFADDQGGAVFGVDLGEKAAKAAPYTKMPDLGATLAARLGTTPSGIQVKDVAVSPVSGSLYVSVRKTDGGNQNAANPANYALFAVAADGKVTPIDLATLPAGKAAVSAEVRYGTREGSPAKIGDIAYAKGRVLVAALSAEQFNSNLVSVPVPFRSEGVERYATSIYHVSHGRQETASPIQTLTVYRDGEKEYLMGAYVCTPVVRFELGDLKPGAVVKGTTVAELGSGNRPMAMVAYGKPGQQSLLLNNSSFGVMKVDAKIAVEREAVNEQTKANRGGGGRTPYPGLEVVESLKGVAGYAVAANGTLLALRPAEGGLALEPMPLP